MPLISPISPVQVVRVKNPIKPLAPKQPVYPVPPIQPGGFRTTPNVGTNPRQINSLSDVLFNDQGRRWATKNFIASDDNLFTWLGDTVTVGVKYLQNQYVEPIADGNWLGFGTNALSAFGEDADLLSNFTKGMIIEAGTQESSLLWGGLASLAAVGATVLSGGTFGIAMAAGFLAGGVTAVGNAVLTDPEGAMRGLSRASGATYEGKYNYNFNVKTGNGLASWLAEMYGEIAVDPLNWLSFGAGMANDLVSEATEELGTQVGKQSNDFLKMFSRLGDLDDVVTKTAFLSNPIGLGLYGLYSGSKYAMSATQRSFVKSFIEGALDAKVFNAKAASTAYSSIEAVTQKEITSLRKTYFKELRFLKKDSQTYYTWLTDVQRRLMSEMKMTSEQAEERARDLLFKFFTEKDTAFLSDFAKNKTQRKAYEKYISDLKLKTLSPEDMAAKGTKALGEFGSAAYVVAGGFKRDVDALNAFVDTISGYSIKTNTFVLAMDERMTKVINDVQKSMNFELYGRSKAEYVHAVYQSLQKEFPDFITLDFMQDRRFAAWVYGSLMADTGITFEEFFNIQKAMQNGAYVFDHPETTLDAIKNQIKGVSTITSAPFNESIARLKDLEILSPEQRDLLKRLNADQYKKMRETIESQVPKGYKPKKIMDHVISMIPKFFTAERKLEYVKRLTVDPNTQDLMDFVHTYGQIEDDAELVRKLGEASGIDDALVLENMRRIIRDVETVSKYASDTSGKLEKSIKKRASDAKKAASGAKKKGGLLAQMAEMKTRPEDEFIQAYLNLSRTDYDSLRNLFIRQGYEGDAFLKNFEALNFIDPHPFFGIEEAAAKVLKDSGAYILNINKSLMDQIMATDILESDLLEAFNEVMDETNPLGKLFALIVRSDLSHPDFEDVYRSSQKIYASLKSFQHYVEMSQNMRQIIDMDMVIEPNRKLIMGMKVPAKLIQDSDGVIRLKTIKGNYVEMTIDDIYKNEEYSKAFLNEEGMFTVFDMDNVNLVNSEDVLTELEGAKRISTTFADELEELRTRTIADRVVKVAEETKKLEDIDETIAEMHRQQDALKARITAQRAELNQKIVDLETKMDETQRKIDSFKDDSQDSRDAIGKLNIEKANLTLRRNALRDSETDTTIAIAKLQKQNETYIRDIKRAEVQRKQAADQVKTRLSYLESKYDQLNKAYEWNKKTVEGKLKNKVFAVAKAVLRKGAKEDLLPDLTGVLDSIPAAMKAVNVIDASMTDFYSTYVGIKKIIDDVNASSSALDTYLGDAIFKQELVNRLDNPFPHAYRPSDEFDTAIFTFEKNKSLKRQTPGAPKTYQQDIHNVIFKQGRTRPVFLGGYAPEDVGGKILQWPSVNAFINFRDVIDGQYLSHIYAGKNNLDGMQFRVGELVDRISASIATKELEVQDLQKNKIPAITNAQRIAKSELTKNITDINREIQDILLSTANVEAYHNVTQLKMISDVAKELRHDTIDVLSAGTTHGKRLHELLDLRSAAFNNYDTTVKELATQADESRALVNRAADLEVFKTEVEQITKRFTRHDAEDVWRYITKNIEEAESYEAFKSDLVLFLNQKIALKGSTLAEQKAEALGLYGRHYLKAYLDSLGRGNRDSRATEDALNTVITYLNQDMEDIAKPLYSNDPVKGRRLMPKPSVYSGAQLEADARLLTFDSMMKADAQWNLVNMDEDSLKNYFGGSQTIYKQYYQAPREMMASIVDGRSPLWDTHNKEVQTLRRTEFIDKVMLEEEKLYAAVQPKIKEAELKYKALKNKVDNVLLKQSIAPKTKAPSIEELLQERVAAFSLDWTNKAVGEHDARLYNDLMAYTELTQEEQTKVYMDLATNTRKFGADEALVEFEKQIRDNLRSDFKKTFKEKKMVSPNLTPEDFALIKERDAALKELQDLKDKSVYHSRAKAIVRAQDMADTTLRDKGGIPHLVWDEATVKWYLAKYPQFKITDVSRMLYRAMEEHPDWPVYIRNHVVPVAKQGSASGLDEVGEFTKAHLVHQWLRRGTEFYYDVPQDPRKLLTYEDFITQLRNEFDGIRGLTRHNGVWGYGETQYQPEFFGQSRDFTRKVTTINNIPPEATDLLKSYTYSRTPEFKDMSKQIAEIKKAGVNLDGAPFGMKLSKDTTGLATKVFEPIKGYPLQVVPDHSSMISVPKQLLEPSDLVVVQQFRTELTKRIEELNKELEDFLKSRIDKMGNRTLPSLLQEAKDADTQLSVGTRAIVATYGGGVVVDIKDSLIVDNMYKQAYRSTTMGAQGSMKFDKEYTRSFDVVGEELRVAESELESMRQDFEVRKLDPKTKIDIFEENIAKKTAQVDILRREMKEKYQKNLQDAQRWIKDKAILESGRTDVAVIRLDKPLKFTGKTVFTKAAVEETDKLRFAALDLAGNDVVKRVEEFWNTAKDITLPDGKIQTVAEQFEQLDRFFIIPDKLDSMYAGNLGRITNITLDTSRVETSGLYQKMYKIDYELYHYAEDGTIAPFKDVLVRKSVDETGPVHAASAYNIYERYATLLKKRARYEKLVDSNIEKDLMEGKTTTKEIMDRLHGRGTYATNTSQNVYDRKAELGHLDTAPGDMQTYEVDLPDGTTQVRNIVPVEVLQILTPGGVTNFSKHNDAYAYLGNMDKLPRKWPVHYNGLEFHTVEAAYQAAKFKRIEDQIRVRDAGNSIGKNEDGTTFIKYGSGADAKRVAYEIWDEYKAKPAVVMTEHMFTAEEFDAQKMNLMYGLLRDKFRIPHLAKKLVETGKIPLVEGNYWGDDFWGVNTIEGENHLGELLMRIRGELGGTGVVPWRVGQKYWQSAEPIKVVDGKVQNVTKEITPKVVDVTKIKYPESDKLRIISGGQAGGDLGGLIAAKKLGLPTGGIMPKGFKTEDGAHPEFAKEFGIIEDSSDDYVSRTKKNVDSADATIAFLWDPEKSKGTLKTIGYAQSKVWRNGTPNTSWGGYKPVLVVTTKDPDEAAKQIKEFMASFKPRVLNIAGHRESHQKGIQRFVADTLFRGLAEPGQGTYMYKLPKVEEAVESAAEVIKRPVTEGLDEYYHIPNKTKVEGTRFEEMHEYLNRVKEAEANRLKNEQFSDADLVRFGLELRKSNPTLAKWYDQLSRDLKIDFIHNPTIPEEAVIEHKSVQRVAEQMADTTARMENTRTEFGVLNEKITKLEARQTGIDNAAKVIDERMAQIQEEQWGIRNKNVADENALFKAKNDIAGDIKATQYDLKNMNTRMIAENANEIEALKKARFEQQRNVWGVEKELGASKTTSFAKGMRHAEMVKMFGPNYKEFEAYIELLQEGKITPEEFITIIKRADGIIEPNGNTFLSRRFATQRVIDKIQNYGIHGGKVMESVFQDEPEVAEKLYQRALNILSEFRSFSPSQTVEALTEDSLRAKFALVTTNPRYAAAIDTLINEIYNYLGLQKKFESMGAQTIMFPDSEIKQLFDGLMGGKLEEFLTQINDPTFQKEMYIEKIRGFYSAFVERTDRSPAVLDQLVKGQADILELQKMAHQYYFIAKKSVSNLIQTNEMVGAIRLDSEGSPVAGIIQRFLNAGGRKLIEANPELQAVWDVADVKGREALIKKYGIDVQVEDVLTDVYENMITKRGIREMETIDIGDMSHLELRTELNMAIADGDGAEIARLHQELSMKEFEAAQRATQGIPGAGDALYNAQINNHTMLEATSAVQLQIAKTRMSFGGLAEPAGYELLAQRGGKMISEMLDFNKGDRSLFARIVRFHTPGGLVVIDRDLLGTLDGRTILELQEKYGIDMIESNGKLPTDFNLVGFKVTRKVDDLEKLGPLDNTLVKGYDDLKGIDFESRAILDNFYNEFQNVATQTFPFHWSNMPLYRFKDTSLVPWLFDRGFIGENEINAFSSALQDSGALSISVIGGKDMLKGVVDILPYSPLDMMVTSGYSLSRHSTAKPKFLRLFMQDDYKVASYFGTSDPKEAFRIYQGSQEELEVVILKKDLNLHRVAINSWKDMEFAMKNKAIVTNYPGFVQMYKALDTWKMPALLDWMDRNLNSVFKSGIMTSFGLATRNFFDNNVKLLAMAKGDVDVFAFIPEAHRYIDRFTKMAMELEGFQDGRKVLAYLKGASDEDRMIFMLMMQAKQAQIAGAPLDAIMDVTEATRLATAIRMGDVDEGSLIQNIAWGNPLTQFALSMQNWSEQRWRLAAYLYLIDAGKSTSEASKKVAEYFIDYSVKGKSMKVLNVLMPFSMFTVKNTLLWAKHAMDTPWLLRTMVDMGSSTWNNVQAEQNGYMSASQKRNYLSGNVSLGGSVVKANPSFFDAVNTIPGVIQDPLGRLSPVIKDAVKVMQGDMDGLIMPWEGVASRAQTVFQGVQDLAAGNGITPSQVVPSLFSEMTTYTNSFTSYKPQPRYRGIYTSNYAVKMAMRNTNRIVQSSMLYRKNYYNVVWRNRFKPKKFKPF